MTATIDETGRMRVDARRRLAACLSLGAVAAAMVVVLVGLRGQVGRVGASLAAPVVVTVACWFAVTRRGLLRTVADDVQRAAVMLEESGRSDDGTGPPGRVLRTGADSPVRSG
jgi:hypothetical protein